MRYISLVSFLLWVLVCLIPVSGTAQEESHHLQHLMEMNLEDLLNMKVVAAARHEQRLIDSPRSVSIITAEEIRKRNCRTTPEALNELVGILVQETNYGGGSPIIRGLVGNQILVLVDGIRLNNAIFRLGPNQYLNTIDVNQIERIEVVRGPGSVLYGSDALGGFINIVTKSTQNRRKAEGFGARLFGRYASADKGETGRLDFSQSIKNIGITAGVSLKNFHDLRAGSGIGLQPYTGYEEWDADFKLNYQLTEKHNIVLGLQHVNQSEVPRTDKLISGSDLKRQWNPETRDLAYVRYDLEGISSFVNGLRAGLSYQNQSEDIDRISSSKPGTQQEYHDEVNSVGLMFQLHSRVGQRQLLTYGGEYYADHVRSRRVDVDLASSTRTDGKGTFSDGSTYQSRAAFLQDELQVTDPLSLILGFRYTSFEVRARVNDPLTGEVEVHSTPHALTGNLNALYRLSKNFVVSLGVAQGFRAPNIDDLTILGSFGSGFEVPNPDLTPEQSLNYEIGLKTHHQRFSGSLYYHLSNFEDMIERSTGTFNGLSFLDSNDDDIQDENEESVFQRRNIGRARIQGVEAEGRLRVLQTWTLSGNIAWIKGDDLIENQPLRRIPPLSGKLGVECQLKRKMWVECYSLFAARQDRLAPGDVEDPRIPAGGTPGFATFNLRGGVDFNHWGNLTIALENLGDEAYRLHGSGVDSPGRNLVVGYELPF